MSWEDELPFLLNLAGNRGVQALSCDLHTMKSPARVECLASNLTANSSLQRLVLVNIPDDMRTWKLMLDSIRSHPALIYCDFSTAKSPDGDYDAEKLLLKVSRTRMLLTYLAINREIEEIRYHDHVYDAVLWTQKVVPLMEYNYLQKRIASLKRPSQAVIVNALGRVSNHGVELLWKLLSKHPNAVCSAADL